MRVDDMIILSIDDHLIEPPDMFDHHVPERSADQAPKLLRRPDGNPFAHIQKEQATVGALRAQARDVDTSIVSRSEFRARYDANPRYQIEPVGA